MNFIKGLTGLGKIREDIFYISDHLFFDDEVLYERGYVDHDDMIEDMVFKWNSKIKPNDIVFYLGNFTTTKSKKIEDVLKKLNGRINLIVGTKDNNSTVLSCKKQLQSVFYKLEVFVNDIPITMNHHPQFVWNRQEYGAWHLHGNLRYKQPTLPYERIFDVSVDGKNFGEPYSFDDIYDIMGEKDYYKKFENRKKHIQL